MALVLSNRISYEVPEADGQAIDAAIQVLQEKLQPHLVDLGVQDRRALPKMGTKTVEFVSKALKYVRDNPEFKPAFLDADEFERDFLAVEALRALQRPLCQLTDMVEDSLMLSGSEAYNAALAYYEAAKAAARRGLPGAAVVADDLGAQFSSRGDRPATARTPAPAGVTQPPAAA